MCRLDASKLVSSVILNITPKQAMFTQRAPPMKISLLASACELRFQCRLVETPTLMIAEKVRVANLFELLRGLPRHTKRAELALENTLS